jgi:hypothetical protein
MLAEMVVSMGVMNGMSINKQNNDTNLQQGWAVMVGAFGSENMHPTDKVLVDCIGAFASFAVGAIGTPLAGFGVAL